MAGKRINDPSIPTATLIKDTDVFYLIQDGVDHNITGAMLKAALSSLTNPMTTLGDVIVAGVDGVPSRLAIGGVGTFLAVGEDGKLTYVPRPGSSSGTGLINPMTSQNDLIVGGLNGEAIRLAGGANGDFLQIIDGVLTYAPYSSNPTELTNPMIAVGDMIIGGASGAPSRLVKGANGTSLKIVDGVPTWVDTPSARHSVQAVDNTIERDLTTADDGKYLRAGTFTLAGETIPSNLTWTVLNQSGGQWADNAEITIEQSGQSIVAIVPATGVTINRMATLTNRTRGQFAVITLKRTGLNTWTLFGNLETP